MESPIRRNAAAAAAVWTLAVGLAGLAAPESLLAAPRNAPASAPSVPLVFEENRGQADPHVMFLARGAAYSLSIAATEAALVNHRTGQIVRIRLLGARPDVEVTALEPLPGRIHYIRGRNPAGWQTDVPTYGRVAYREVYPGIDAFYKPASGATFEQEFLVRPDADPAAIRLAFDGAQRVVVDKTGDLVLATEKAPVRLGRPIAYQDIDGVRRAVSVAWSTRGPGEAGFRLGPYDRSRPLVIDPVITWATYLGDNGPEGRHQAAFGVAVDSAGNSYVTGDAILPSTGIDVFVTKLNSTGQKLIYSVFIGGSREEGGRAIALDPDGNAYVAGTTTSADFPVTPGALQTRHGGGSFDFPLDAFVLKLGPAGIPIYSTYLGGRDDDVALGIGVDAVGRAYVTGGTRSTDFPVANAFQPRLAGVVEDQCEPRHLGGEFCDEDGCRAIIVPGTCPRDAFVARLSAEGIIEYSTFLGGSADDVANAIALDDVGNAYVTGSSQGTFPVTAGSLQTNFGGPDGGLDAFVARIDTNATLGWATYLGGKDADIGTGIAVDDKRRLHVVGNTASPDFPATDGDRFTTFGIEGYVVKVDADGRTIIWSRNTGFALPAGVALDSQSRAHLVGSVTVCPRDRRLECNQDVSVETRAATGEKLSFFSFGGSASGHNCCNADDFGEAIAVSGNSVWVVGSARSDDFPTTPGTVQPTRPFPSMWAFVARLDEPAAPAGDNDNSSHKCLIATAAFGSAHVWEVATLRRFRDRVLLPHAPGRLFVRAYYRLSPPLARAVASHPPLAAVVRALLTPVAVGADFAMDRPEIATRLVGLGLAVIVGLGIMRVRRAWRDWWIVWTG